MDHATREALRELQQQIRQQRVEICAHILAVQVATHHTLPEAERGKFMDRVSELMPFYENQLLTKLADTSPGIAPWLEEGPADKV